MENIYLLLTDLEVRTVSIKMISFFLRTIVNIRAILSYRASYQGCGGGTVVQVLLCFPSAGFYSCRMWFFFFICMFNATLIKSDFGYYNNCSDWSDQSRVQCINSGISRK